MCVAKKSLLLSASGQAQATWGDQRKIRAGADSSERAQVPLSTPHYRHTLHTGEDYVNSVAFGSHEYK